MRSDQLRNKLKTSEDIRELEMCKALSVLDISYNSLEEPDVLEVLAKMLMMTLISDNNDHGRTWGVHQDADNGADNDDDGRSQGARQDARAARAHLHGQPDHQEDSRLSQKRTSQVS